MPGAGRYATRTTVTDPTSLKATAAADPRRVYIGFIPPTGLGNFTITVTTDDGNAAILNPSTSLIVEFFWSRHGSLVSLPWVLTTAMGTVAYIVEVLDLRYEPEV